MHITRILPTADDLVRRAFTATPFLAEITAAPLHHIKIAAKLSAELAAEDWERATGSPLGLTIDGTLIAEVETALLTHHQTAVYTAYAKIDRSVAQLAALRHGIAGPLPLAGAEELMATVEGDIDVIGVALKRVHELFERAIGDFEIVAPGWDRARDPEAA